MALFTIDNQVGKPYQAYRHTLYPVAQVIRVNYPGNAGGFTWSRPYRLIVQDPAGQYHTHPIQDVTRQAQVFFLGLAMISGLLWFLFKQTRPQT